MKAKSTSSPHIHNQAPLPVPVQFDRSWQDELDQRLRKGGPWGDWNLYQLAIEAEKAKLVPSFDELQCLQHLQDLTPLPISWIPLGRYCFKCPDVPFLPMKSA